MTLKDFENGGKFEENVVISRKHDNTQSKLTEYEQNDLKIGLKIFVNNEDPLYVVESVEKGG